MTELRGVISAPPQGYRGLVQLHLDPTNNRPHPKGSLLRNVTSIVCPTKPEAAAARDILSLWLQFLYSQSPAASRYNYPGFIQRCLCDAGFVGRVAKCTLAGDVRQLLRELSDNGSLAAASSFGFGFGGDGGEEEDNAGGGCFKGEEGGGRGVVGRKRRHDSVPQHVIDEAAAALCSLSQSPYITTTNTTACRHFPTKHQIARHALPLCFRHGFRSPRTRRSTPWHAPYSILDTIAEEELEEQHIQNNVVNIINVNTDGDDSNVNLITEEDNSNKSKDTGTKGSKTEAEQTPVALSVASGPEDASSRHEGPSHLLNQQNLDDDDDCVVNHCPTNKHAVHYEVVSPCLDDTFNVRLNHMTPSSLNYGTDHQQQQQWPIKPTPLHATDYTSANAHQHSMSMQQLVDILATMKGLGLPVHEQEAVAEAVYMQHALYLQAQQQQQYLQYLADPNLIQLYLQQQQRPLMMAPPPSPPLPPLNQLYSNTSFLHPSAPPPPLAFNALVAGSNNINQQQQGQLGGATPPLFLNQLPHSLPSTPLEVSPQKRQKTVDLITDTTNTNTNTNCGSPPRTITHPQTVTTAKQEPQPRVWPQSKQLNTNLKHQNRPLRHIGPGALNAHNNINNNHNNSGDGGVKNGCVNKPVVTSGQR